MKLRVMLIRDIWAGVIGRTSFNSLGGQMMLHEGPLKGYMKPRTKKLPPPEPPPRPAPLRSIQEIHICRCKGGFFK